VRIQGRPIFRRLARPLLRTATALLSRTEVRGLEHVPRQGPLIIAQNHLGPLDPPLTIAFVPCEVEVLALADLCGVPVTRKILQWYGVIPVHRDRRDGEAMASALHVLDQGGIILIEPEGRMSTTGALERARTGVGYLAMTTGAPVLPVAFTGTERTLADLRAFRRPRHTMTVGEPLRFPREQPTGLDRHDRLRQVTDQIMFRIAAMLPPTYRGVYGP
jgi:1-acyl-sn-glycerol-3-phosphate acyltransferase